MEVIIILLGAALAWVSVYVFLLSKALKTAHEDYEKVYDSAVEAHDGWKSAIEEWKASNDMNTQILADWKKSINRYTPLAQALCKTDEWALHTFEGGTEENLLMHYLEEVDELYESPLDPMEMADVIMLMVRAARVQGFELSDAVFHKLAVNRIREWTKDENGISTHV